MKKINISIIIAIAAIGISAGISFAFSTGDLDNNGKVESNDAIIGLQSVAGLRTEPNAGLIDVITALQVLAGKPIEYTNGLGMTFRLIPPGTFMMGSPPDEPGRVNWETQHQVTLTQPFFIMTTEVTQRQWRDVMGSSLLPRFINCGNDCPMENISWDDVQTFIGYMNQRGEGQYRLPTEAEWEYSARAGTNTALYNGPIVIDGEYNAPTVGVIGWYGGNSCVTYSGKDTICIGSSEKEYPCLTGCGTNLIILKMPNVWGLYDMIGNVWEWCQDWYSAYPTDPVSDPTGPVSGTYKIRRGGAWNATAAQCRSASRFISDPSKKSEETGFRLVRSVP